MFTANAGNAFLFRYQYATDDFPNPSCLIFGYNVNGRILHIVAGCDNINIYIITAYYPDTKKFEDDLKTRRKR